MRTPEDGSSATPFMQEYISTSGLSLQNGSTHSPDDRTIILLATTFGSRSPSLCDSTTRGTLQLGTSEESNNPTCTEGGVTLPMVSMCVPTRQRKGGLHGPHGKALEVLESDSLDIATRGPGDLPVPGLLADPGLRVEQPKLAIASGVQHGAPHRTPLSLRHRIHKLDPVGHLPRLPKVARHTVEKPLIRESLHHNLLAPI
mmetsp:Transcript_19155/g.53410  ORF Transcript_19155/g.53410 Transcript_19155/m.53410 type:complete len:201 (+) Transcript_19155:1113-1715(+)